MIDDGKIVNRIAGKNFKNFAEKIVEDGDEARAIFIISSYLGDLRRDLAEESRKDSSNKEVLKRLDAVDRAYYDASQCFLKVAKNWEIYGRLNPSKKDYRSPIKKIMDNGDEADFLFHLSLALVKKTVDLAREWKKSKPKDGAQREKIIAIDDAYKLIADLHNTISEEVEIYHRERLKGQPVNAKDANRIAAGGVGGFVEKVVKEDNEDHLMFMLNALLAHELDDMKDRLRWAPDGDMKKKVDALERAQGEVNVCYATVADEIEIYSSVESPRGNYRPAVTKIIEAGDEANLLLALTITLANKTYRLSDAWKATGRKDKELRKKVESVLRAYRAVSRCHDLVSREIKIYHPKD